MSDPTEKAIEAIVKQLPIKQIYDDAGSGAAKQTGRLLTDITKVIRLALFPIQALAAIQDRAEQFIDRSIRRVPEENRIPPAPQILGPVLEGLKYEPDDTPITEMFSQLLSRAMDQTRVDEAHPAFPILIKQLSPDEAIIISTLKARVYDYVHTRDYDNTRALFIGPNKVEVDTFPRDGLSFPDNLHFYIDHLNRLGLAGLFQQGNQEPIFDTPRTKQIGVRVRSSYLLTEFGRRFADACIEGGG